MATKAEINAIDMNIILIFSIELPYFLIYIIIIAYICKNFKKILEKEGLLFKKNN